MNLSKKAERIVKGSPIETKRKLIKSAILGTGVVGSASAMPSKWTKPVIDSVILPSHAETTDDSGSSPGDKVISSSRINHKNIDYDTV